MNRTYRATFTVTVEITVPDEAITRVLNNEDGWREKLYDLRTEREVIEHLGFNCGIQGSQLRQLDGWADMDDDGWGRILECDMDEYERIDAPPETK